MEPQYIISAIGSIALPLVVFALNFAHQKDKDNKAAAQLAEKVNFKRYADLQKNYERLTLEMHTFQLDVAQRYATIIALREAEARFSQAVERFEDKLDRFMEMVTRGIDK